jgi:CRP-like cAMP-binding protein
MLAAMAVDVAELAALPVFGALSEDELARLAAAAERVEVGESGVELTSEGDFGHSVLVVLDGTAQVSVDGNVVRDLTRGDLFGEIAVLSSGRRTATVVSSTPMALVSVFKRDVWAIEGKNDAFAAELRRIRESYG